MGGGFCSFTATAEASNMFTKVLFAACALFVVAHATDIYSASWEGTDCSGTAVHSAKGTLDQCFNGGTAYFKTSLSGSTYTINVYASTDTTCTTPALTVSGAADACLLLAGSSYVKVLSGSTYLSGAAANQDCTSGTCVTDTGNSACHVSIGIMSVFLGLVAHWIA